MIEQLRERWPLVLWALLICGAVILAFPHAMSALYLEAGGRAMDEPAQAVAHLQKALTWDGANSQAYRLLAQAYLALGQPDAAIEALTQASALRPKNPLLHMELAQAYEARGQAPGEDPDLDRKAAREWMLAGLNVDKLLDQGEKYRQEGFPDEALVWYERAMRLEPDLGDPWYYVGLLREGQGDYEGALAAYERALELGRLERVGESMVHCRVGTATTQTAGGSHLAAVDAFSTGLSADDFTDTAIKAACIFHRGQALEKTGAPPGEFMADYREAIAIDPTHVEAHIMLALALYKHEHNVSEAEANLKRAIELAPSSKWPLYHLAELYRKENRVEEARLAYTRALEIDPRFTAAQERLDSLPSEQP